MNEVVRAIKERACVRKFSDKPLPRELVEQVVEAGLCAPSGMNRQPVVILAVRDRALRDRLSEANRKIMGAPEGTDPFYGAPVVLVALARKDSPTYLYDGSVAMENMLLAAQSLGLGACWVHRAKEEFETDEFKAVLDQLGVKGDYEGIGHCILGYPAEKAEPKPVMDGRVFWAE